MKRLIKKKFKWTANQGLCLEVQQRLSKKKYMESFDIIPVQYHAYFLNNLKKGEHIPFVDNVTRREQYSLEVNLKMWDQSWPLL